jgi:hypothetical protein
MEGSLLAGSSGIDDDWFETRNESVYIAFVYGETWIFFWKTSARLKQA